MRKVTLCFRGRDQGWVSRPDQGSWSWFEVSVAQVPGSAENEEENGCEDRQCRASDGAVWTGPYFWVKEWMQQYGVRLEKQLRYKIQGNRQAGMIPENYSIELTDEHELVQRIQEGDRVVLWACACFPGWENRVYEAKVSVMGIDDLTME